MQVASAQSFSAFGGGVAESAAQPLALGVLAIAAALIFTLPRKHVIVPLLLAAFLIPMGNVLVVAGIHIMPVRMLVLCGWIRLSFGGFSSKTKIPGSGWNSIDKAVLCWAGFRALDFILLWRAVPAVINQAGFLWSDLGMYFLLRFLIKDDDDIRRVVKLFVLIAVVNGAEMAFEHSMGRNVFGLVLGGVNSVPLWRDGQFRSQGAFAISITAGTFGAALIPLSFWLWKGGRAKGAAAVAFIFATVMILTSASSTGLLGAAAAICGMCLWPLRGRMQLVRRCIVGALVGFQLVMKAPIWFILNHVNVIGASSGYHRSMLIDSFVRHFGDWWLLGVKDTADWGWDMYDHANQFVAEGESGGLIAFIFFIVMIKRAFGALGTARKTAAGDKRQESLLWSLGAMLFAYIISFLGISLWDQTQVAWLALFAMICAASFPRIVEKQDRDDGMPPADGLEDVGARSEVSHLWYGMSEQEPATQER